MSLLPSFSSSPQEPVHPDEDGAGNLFITVCGGGKVEQVCREDRGQVQPEPPRLDVVLPQLRRVLHHQPLLQVPCRPGTDVSTVAGVTGDSWLVQGWGGTRGWYWDRMTRGWYMDEGLVVGIGMGGLVVGTGMKDSWLVQGWRTRGWYRDGGLVVGSGMEDSWLEQGWRTRGWYREGKP